ncbi:hypothetical protein BDR07DRAFT_1422374 [Suillus spraguei]|nr:hypothetical protein BDR07DRAFT_1422374 [Suillus spraguei]
MFIELYDLVSHSLQSKLVFRICRRWHDIRAGHLFRGFLASPCANPYWPQPQIFRTSVRLTACNRQCGSHNVVRHAVLSTPNNFFASGPIFLTPAELLNLSKVLMQLPVKSSCAPRWYSS